MKLFFAWVEADEVFDATKHCVMDMPIFSCVITQKETESAMARVTTDATVVAEARVALISYRGDDAQDEAHVLFRGRLVGVPKMLSDGQVEWELSAASDEAVAQMNEAAKALANDPSHLFEPGFYSAPAEAPNLSNVLESCNEVMHWDRCSGALSLSNLFHGRAHKIVEGEIFEGSLKVTLGATPLNQVNVLVEANWVQRYEGVFNVAPMIAGQFSKGVMNTLTPNALIQQWPRVGDKIGSRGSRSFGYTVVKSALKRLKGEALEGMRQTTAPIEILDRGKVLKKIFKYAWFKGSLWLNWLYRQPCGERMRFSVSREASVVEGNARQLILKLPHADRYLSHPSAVSLFQEPRGVAVLNYAKAVAMAHMRGSMRQLEVEFAVPFSKAWAIDLDTSVTVRHSSIPNGALTGKIVRYAFVCDADQWVAVVQVAVSLQSIEPVGALQAWDLVCVNDEVRSQLVDPATFMVDDLVEEIEVGGDATLQVTALQGAALTCGEGPKQGGARSLEVLKAEPFFVHMRLRNLTPRPFAAVAWVQRGSFVV